MADIEPSTLRCDESKDLCFNDLDAGGFGEPIDDHADQKENDRNRSEPSIHLPEQSDEGFAAMVERERDYLPKEDYLKRLRRGELDLSARREAFDWILKAHCHYSFGPLCLCLAVNYLDRFLSIRDLPRDKDWAVQLLALACLSIAAKMEETSVPQSIELQVGDPKFVFEAKTIQRMELLVLDTLNWKVNAITPCSLVDFCLRKLSEVDNNNFLYTTTTKVVNRSMQLILCTTRGIDFLEFRPSEIAAAVAMSVTAEFQAVNIDKTISCFIHLEKDMVMKCVEMMKDMLSQMRRSGKKGTSSGQSMPQSPSGVLDASCFSYKTDELTLTPLGGSFANSSNITTTTSSSPQTKRMKLDTTSTSGFNS